MLEEIYNNQTRISELKAEISRIEKENAELIEDAISKNVSSDAGYTLKLEPGRSTRIINKNLVVAVIGRDAALKYASFALKDLEKAYPKEQVDKWCSIKQSPGKYVVVIDDERK